jgi:hypothetical protein
MRDGCCSILDTFEDNSGRVRATHFMRFMGAIGDGSLVRDSVIGSGITIDSDPMLGPLARTKAFACGWVVDLGAVEVKRARIVSSTRSPVA